MAAFKIAVVVGSNRRESINRRLAEALAKLGPDRLAFHFVQIGDLPLYNQDDEGNLPSSVTALQGGDRGGRRCPVRDARVQPFHSGGAEERDRLGARPWGRNSWTGKVAAVTGTSPGAISTALAQQHLRQILGAQGVVLSGGEAYIQFKQGLIDDNGNVPDESTRGFLKSFLDQFATLVGRLAPAPRVAA